MEWLRSREDANDLHLGPDRAMLQVGSEHIDVMADFDPVAVIADYMSTLDEDARARFGASHALSDTQHITTKLLRIELYKGNGLVCLSTRILPPDPPQFADLHWPDEMLKGLESDTGLVVIAGPQDQGKSTLLAAMIRYLNENRENKHFFLVENPIEYPHRPTAKNIITQQRVGPRNDTPNFAASVRKALRVNARIIAITEAFADDDTIPEAINAVDAGALVLLTMHAPNVATAIQRIYRSLRESQRARFWDVFADQARLITSLRLVPGRYAGTLYPICDMLIPDQYVRTQIRRQDFTEIRNGMLTGASAGARALEAELVKLVKEGKVHEDEARRMAPDPDTFDQLYLRPAMAV